MGAPPPYETVAGMWDSFARGVLADDAPPLQREMMKRAYYAGCWAMLQLTRHVAATAADPQAAADRIADREDELRQYQRGLIAGATFHPKTPPTQEGPTS